MHNIHDPTQHGIPNPLDEQEEDEFDPSCDDGGYCAGDE